MDRILYFRKAKGRNDIPTYRVNIFRAGQGGFLLYYLQLSGDATEAELTDIFGEMQKALVRLQYRYRKEEEALHTYLVYEEEFEKWLKAMDREQEWQRLWSLPLYSDYHHTENLKELLQHIPKKNWPKKALILGSGMGMQDWLPLIAGHVQNMELYLEFMTKGVEALQDELCEEYGMMPQVRLVAPGEFCKERLRSSEPVLVIDFSGSRPISVLGLAKGSIWVDMDSAEAKRHLIEDRRTGLIYLSLKTIWKREMLETLDTICKFAYNTEVKIGRK